MGEEVPWIIWQTQQYNSYMGEEVPWIIWQTQQYNSYMGEEVPWIIWQTQQYDSYMGEEIPWIIWQTQQYNSYIMATSFSGGRSRSTRREPPTIGKQLVNFITCGCESSAPFLCNLP